MLPPGIRSESADLRRRRSSGVATLPPDRLAGPLSTPTHNKTSNANSNDNNHHHPYHYAHNSRRLVSTPPSTQQPQHWRYDGDGTTSLDNHRRLSSMESELRHWKERAKILEDDVPHRERELHRRSSEYASARQHYEHVIRELLEKQNNLTAELQHLRGVAATKGTATERELLQVREELRVLQASGRREMEVVLEKLAKADVYIQTLSDEAVSYQMEIGQLRAELNEKKKATITPTRKQEEAKLQRTGNNTVKEQSRTLQGVLAQLTDVVLACADGCDEMSRECEELIDVVKEEQQHPFTESNVRSPVPQMPTKGNSPTHPITFISCKPTGIELEHLLRASLTQQEQRKDNNIVNKKKEEDKNDDSFIEVTVRIIIQVLQGMQHALHAAKDDILIAGRAYAALCRAGRDVQHQYTALQRICMEEQAHLTSARAAAEEERRSASAAQQRADQLQLALDDTAAVMSEAAALAEERTARVEKLLQVNTALETALQEQQQQLREREMACRAVEDKLHTVQDEMRREQGVYYNTHEELHRTQQALRSVQAARDEAETRLREAEHRLQLLQEASRQCDVDRLYLRKHVAALESQLAHIQQDRRGLREAKELGEWETRQLKAQMDRMWRGCGGAMNSHASNIDSNTSKSEHVKGVAGLTNPLEHTQQGSQAQMERELQSYSNNRETTRGMAGTPIRGATQVEGVPVMHQDMLTSSSPVQESSLIDKVEWWEAKLSAITSSLSVSHSLNHTHVTPPGGDNEVEKTVDHQFTEEGVSLAYGTSTVPLNTDRTHDAAVS